MANQKMKAPYGAWQSPITAEIISNGQYRLNNITSHYHQNYGHIAFWCEGHSKKNGHNILFCYYDNTVIQLTDDNFSIGSKIHEYGGIAYHVSDNGIYAIAQKSQALYFFDFDETVSYPKLKNKKIIFQHDDFSLGQPLLRQNKIICIAENTKTHDNMIVRIECDTGNMVVLESGHDFYAQLSLSHDNHLLSWIAWDLPYMPWDNAVCYEGIFDRVHSDIIEKSKISPHNNHTSVTQSFYNIDNRLYFNADGVDGFWQLQYYQDNHLHYHTLKNINHYEFGKPLWNLGMNNFLLLSDNDIFACYCDNGTWYSAIINADLNNFQKTPLPFTSYHSFACFGDNHIIMHIGFDNRSDAIVLVNRKDWQWCIIREAASTLFDEKFISIGQNINYKSSNNADIQAYYYPPKNDNYTYDDTILPPLIVKVHGGPTGQAHNDFSLAIQYWTSRGFALLDVNYRGSTGFGRQYRESLYRYWGIYDREDMIAGANYLLNNHLVDKNALFVSGSSAGGYSVLAALTFDDYFCGGCSKYGIGDLSALVNDTHKFESGYCDILIANYKDNKQIFYDRSPVCHTDKLSCPILFLQGNDDKIVPPNQAHDMIAALKTKNIPYAAVFFDDEGHGFRKSENIIRALHAELTFYTKILSNIYQTDVISDFYDKNLEFAYNET